MPITIIQKNSKIAACEDESFDPKTYSKTLYIVPSIKNTIGIPDQPKLI